jgi:trimethylamine--corrinoid protein Co-methyltransferase
VLDAQAGFEKALTAFPLLLAGTDIIYGVGAIDAGSSISYLQMILDNELIAGLRRMMEGITTHDLEEEIALIKSHTPRGSFLGLDHTRRTFRNHWQPKILNRETFQKWQEKGENLPALCRREAQSILTNHRPAPLPVGVEAELEHIVRSATGADFHFQPV